MGSLVPFQEPVVMLNTPAPELTPALEWINSDPITLRPLRGYVIVLGFWSAGSAYCRNLMDDLRTLQKKYAGALQTAAIHCPKFDAERDPKLVRKTCGRIGAGVRVAHDPGFVTWQHYGITAWPSAVVIDPDGRIHAVLAGDYQRDALDSIIRKLVEENGLALEENLYPPLNPLDRDMPLSFPSGICVNEHLMYVADTGHHTVLECTHAGRVHRTIGSGAPEFNDGPGHVASFRFPRGISLVRDILFVADSGNNAFRRVRLVDGDILTLAGTSRVGQPAGGVLDPGRRVALNQPWAVAATEDRVYISLAGNNQIWMYDRMRNSLQHVAGSGELALADGEADQAAFAQPAGISLAHSMLYVVDSGASALRSVQTVGGKVQTLLGQGLFEFGNATGTRADTRMQYPLAVAKDPDTAHLWILDSYNNAVTKLKLGGNEVTRFEITAKLDCPSAVHIFGGSLWIANTNAHEILRVEMATGAARHIPVAE